jgi:hypothetical protein
VTVLPLYLPLICLSVPVQLDFCFPLPRVVQPSAEIRTLEGKDMTKDLITKSAKYLRLFESTASVL